MRSDLDQSLRTMVEVLCSRRIAKVSFTFHESFMECRVTEATREIHLSTEGKEVILSFGFSHVHSANFVDDTVPKTVAQTRERMIAIMSGEMVSYRVCGSAGVMAGGFCAAHEIDTELANRWGADQWTQMDVMGWNPSNDRSIHRT